MYEPRNCRICGNKFFATSAKQIFCSVECRKEGKKRYNRQYVSGRYYEQKSKKQKREKQKKSLDATIREIEQYNTEHGTRYSYGRYVALKRLGVID